MKLTASQYIRLFYHMRTLNMYANCVCIANCELCTLWNSKNIQIFIWRKNLDECNKSANVCTNFELKAVASISNL